MPTCLNWFLLLLLFFVGASAAAATVAVKVSNEIGSISASIAPISVLEFEIAQSLSGSVLPPALSLARELRAVTAEFQRPLKEMLHLEQMRDRAPQEKDCLLLEASLLELTDAVLDLKAAVFRYDPDFEEQASVDRVHKLLKQIVDDFDKFRDLASKVCPWTDPFGLLEKKFGWWLRFNGYLGAVTNVWRCVEILYLVCFGRLLFKKGKSWWYGAGKEAESENKSKAAVAAPPIPPPPPLPSTAPAPTPAPAPAAAPAAPALPPPPPPAKGKKRRRRNTESARS